MRLKYIPFAVLTLVLMLHSTVNASVHTMNLNVTTAASVDDKESSVKPKTVKPVILAQDNSKILATSGMSTMFTIWNMTPFEYCSNAISFNLRYKRIPCNAKAF